jgi:hypothetical protein
MKISKIIWIAVATIIGFSALLFLYAFIMVINSRLRSSHYRDTAHQIRQQLTPEVLNDLGCSIYSSADGPDILPLTPRETGQARKFLITIIDSSDFHPCTALLEKNTIAPTYKLFFFRGNDGPDRSLISIEIYEKDSLAYIITPTFLPNQPPIVIDMRSLDHEEYGFVIGMLQCRDAWHNSPGPRPPPPPPPAPGTFGNPN